GPDPRQLRPAVHAAQAQDVAQYADRRRAWRAADRGRVDRRRGRARARGGGAVLDGVSVAAAAFPGARLDLPGRLPPRRAGHALGRRPGWAPHRPDGVALFHGHAAVEPTAGSYWRVGLRVP